ncbi:MAG: hypothetical protein GWN55_16600 [Phycisphaerae bacterium]|nr:hypothetical protein [Phycisphaerae bacterium]NIS22536.1 hypothetical protein [candidate division KSB1 bacterium]NIP55108.1 hypothetical protein [Phycisphaerae bacterium]NIS49730.1 hypothetical protein [Phycisphaerae bacterium]NIU28763.1 hypothetical protein [candidate division KSB1 bacterium]
MKKTLIWLIMTMLVVSGCSMLLEQSERELRDLETTRQIAKNYLEIAPMQIGFIKGALGERANELPVQAVNAMIELEQLAMDPNELNDINLGYSLGLRVRIKESMVREILKRYAPEILRYLPGN